ncbi:MAG: alpha/beta hydrolase family protein [Flavobacteriales bacterium]
MFRFRLFLLCFGLPVCLLAQSTTYKGTLIVGSNSLDIIFHIQEEPKGRISASMDVPQQSAMGLKCDEATRTTDSLILKINMIRGAYRGKFETDSTIKGVWNQGMDFPLNLSKVDQALNRPQHPKPTDDYISREVIYKNADASVTFGATITIPKGEGSYPAIVLINGSGQQNRDSEVFGHKLFAVLADFFTRNGYIVLRADDRGVGKTEGDLKFATSADFAEDVKVHLDYLKRLPQTDKKRLYLIGHSEGGMIASMVAASRKDVAGAILLASPGIPIFELLVQQQAEVLKSAGIAEKDIDTYKIVFEALTKAVSLAGDFETARQTADQLISTYRSTANPAVVSAITGITDDESQDNFVNDIAQTFMSPWFAYFLRYNPENDLKKIKIPVLAITGSRDIQVLADPNLEGIRNALTKAKNKNFRIEKMEGYNHLFQKCKICSVGEYALLEETFSPKVMQMMLDWLNSLQQTKKKKK